MTEHRALLITRRDDAEVGMLASSLERIGVPVLRIDADDLDRTPVTADLEAGVLTIGTGRFLPSVTWLRHFSMRAAPIRREASDHMFYGDSWTAFALQLSAVSKATIGGTQPGQLQQLALARALRVRTPRTLVTSDLAVLERLPRGRYVVKALDRHYIEPEPGALAWFLPRVGEQERLIEAAGFAGAPVVVQEYVRHDWELRVYVVGGEVHAFRVIKESPRDIWMRPDLVDVRRVDPPIPVVSAAMALAGRWDLVYGAFDFLIDAGEPVFLEVNAHGDWSWFERKAGVDVVSAAANRTVRDMHWSLVGARQAGRVPPADILAFLGARRM